MSIRLKETATEKRLLKKNVLATAVAAAVFGASAVTSAAQFYLNNDATISAIPGGNVTTNYLINQNATLSTNSSMSVYYGTIDGQAGVATGRGGQVVIGGNLTIHGNVGSTNATSNFTISAGNTLTLASNVSTFTSRNMSLKTNSVLNLGNSTSGYNRGASETLTFSSNITMGSNSTINVGNGTTLNANIYGSSSGQGTLNVLGNFTSGGTIGGAQVNGVDTILDGSASIQQVNVSKGNTLTLSHNVTATRMDINGTVTATGNITAAVSLGGSGVLNLDSRTGSDNAAKVVGAINHNGAGGGANGTLNINGTFTTQGAIGQGGKALAAINIDVDGNPTASTVTFAHNVNATTITLGSSTSQNNATLAISTAITVTGDIASSGNSSAAGVLDINQNTIFVDNIGTSSAAIETITIKGTDGRVATFKDSIYAGNITLESATNASGLNATLAFNGTANTAYTITGQIDGGSFGLGKILVNTGNVTFSNVIGDSYDLSSITIADNAEMNISKSLSINNTMSVVGTLDVNISAVTLHTGGINIGENTETASTLETSQTITLTSDTITTASGGANMAFNNATIRLNGTHSSHATSATAYIDIGTNNQTVTIQGNTTIDIDLGNTVIADGKTIVIIGRGSAASSNGTLNISGNVSMTGYKMFTITTNNSTAFSSGYAANVSDASLNATVNYRSSSSLGLTDNDKTVYDASKAAIAADTAVFQALTGLDTDALLKAALTTMSPATGGAAAASAAISGSSVSTANTRMAYMRQTGLGKGMNAGGTAKDESMWLQIFGASIDQDTVSSVSGYDADGQGIAIGLDGMSADGTTRIGIAGSFAATDVDGKDSTTKIKNDIDTTQIMVYANRDYADGMYLQGVASYSFNDNSGSRRILIGSVDRTASSSYDSGLFTLDVEAGWPKEDDGVTITPTVGLTFSSLSSDAYTETGAGNMNLVVTPADVNTVEGKLGVKMTGESVDADGGIGRPEVRVGVVHNFGDETADSTSKFNAGGSTFTTTGVKTDSTKVDIGIGYSYTTPEGDTEISVNVDGRHSSSYVQYGSGLTVKWKF